jgi:hypothetical protein
MLSLRWAQFFAEAIKGLHQFFKLLLVVAIFSKVDRKFISVWLPLSTRIFETSHQSMWTVSTIASVRGK